MGHHAFNAWEDRKSLDHRPFDPWGGGSPVYAHYSFSSFIHAIEPNGFFPSKTSVIPQHWVSRIGVAFSFGFKTAVGVTMAFVLLQCLWHSVVRQPLTMKRMHSYCISISNLLLRKPEIEIDTMYRIERQDQLYKTLPQALFFSPIIVIFSALTLFLPLAGIFSPASLTVTTKNSTVINNCTIPTGNISGQNTADPSYFLGFNIVPDNGHFTVPPRLLSVTMQSHVDHRILDLPQACGPNCRYKVHVPSFVFNCTPNPSYLPYGLMGNASSPAFPVLWNGTTEKIGPNDFMGQFYVAWQSNNPNGTWGNIFCIPLQAQYYIEVWIIALPTSFYWFLKCRLKVKTNEGVQSVMMNTTEITSPIPSFTGTTFKNSTSEMQSFLRRLASIFYATQTLFLGDVFLDDSQFLIYPGCGRSHTMHLGGCLEGDWRAFAQCYCFVAHDAIWNDDHRLWLLLPRCGLPI